MSSSEKENVPFTAAGILKLALDHKNKLIAVFAGSLVLSFLFTLPVIMKPVYRAEAVIYPVNLQPYSEESPTEQLVQLLQSDEVREKLISRFDLYTHYDIDPNGKYPRFEILKRLDENIKIQKTEYESVEIDVLDKDPLRAAQMCDSLVSMMDQKAMNLLRTRATEISIILKRQLAEKKAELDSVEQRMMEIRTRYGITDYENQVIGFSREYYRSLSSGGVNSRMEEARRNLERYGGELNNLKELSILLQEEFAKYNLSYQQALNDQIKVVKFHNMITKPVPPERKDSPKRSLIMIVFSLAMVFSALMVLLYQQQFRKTGL